MVSPLAALVSPFGAAAFSVVAARAVVIALPVVPSCAVFLLSRGPARSVSPRGAPPPLCGVARVPDGQRVAVGRHLLDLVILKHGAALDDGDEEPRVEGVLADRVRGPARGDDRVEDAPNSVFDVRARNEASPFRAESRDSA